MKTMVIVLFSFLFNFAFAQEEATRTPDADSDAAVKIDINQAKTKKSLVAFPPLQFIGNPAANTNYQSLGAELFKVITNDLSISTYFQFINQSAFLEDTTKTGIKPFPTEPNGFKFDTWKQIGADFLIRERPIQRPHPVPGAGVSARLRLE